LLQSRTNVKKVYLENKKTPIFPIGVKKEKAGFKKE